MSVLLINLTADQQQLKICSQNKLQLSYRLYKGAFQTGKASKKRQIQPVTRFASAYTQSCTFFQSLFLFSWFSHYNIEIELYSSNTRKFSIIIQIISKFTRISLQKIHSFNNFSSKNCYSIDLYIYIYFKITVQLYIIYSFTVFSKIFHNKIFVDFLDFL